MSVLYPAEVDEWWIDTPTPWACIECSDAIAPPLVYWQTSDRTLLLHADCAARLGPHLIADAREAALAAHPEAHWRRRAIATVRHRLDVEERVA